VRVAGFSPICGLSPVPGALIMSVSKESLAQHAATAASLSAVLRAMVSHRGVQAAVALWVVGNLVATRESNA
jgi:hypothetical protein